MKHQEVTNILKNAGFESKKTVWVNGQRILTSGYRVRQFGEEVGIDCCGCLDKMQSIINVLSENGLHAQELFPGGGMLKVTK